MSYTVILDEVTEKNKSPWGNRYIEFSMNEIIALMNGKTIKLYDGEYATFITLEMNVGTYD